MTTSEFSWGNEMTNVDAYDDLGRGLDLVDTRRLIECIERNGVNSKDSLNFNIKRYFLIMTNEQLEIVVNKYNFNPLMRNEYLYFPSLLVDRNYYLFKLLLDNDRDHKYMRYPVKTSEFGKISLDQWFIRKGSKDHWNYHNLKEDIVFTKMKTIYDNHVKKYVSLFDLMKSILEKSDKKRRI